MSREGHGRDRLSLNYRSFMFGKLPPPACPGLCYFPFLSNSTVSNSTESMGIGIFRFKCMIYDLCRVPFFKVSLKFKS